MGPRGDSTVVELFPRYPKGKGLSLVAPTSLKSWKMVKEWNEVFQI